MVRQSRFQYPSALDHVMARGNGGDAVFVTDADRKASLRRLGLACESPGSVNRSISDGRQGGVETDQRTRNRVNLCTLTPFSELCGDIVHAVASIPDSLKIWFYGEKRHEEGKAFGCWVRVGDFASRMELLCEAEVTATTANMESSRDVENPLVKQVEKKGSSSRSCM